MPIGLGATLGIGGGRSATSSGAPASSGNDKFSVDFDGVDDYVDLGTGSELDLGASTFTVSLWFKHSATSGNARGMFSIGSFTEKMQITTGYLDAGIDKVGFGYGSNGTFNNWLFNCGSGLNDGNWHHIACVLSSGSPTIYVDNSTVSGTSGSAHKPNDGDNRIGDARYGYFDGLIDEVAIWDSALSSANVTTIYNSGSPTDISDLSPVGWWRMGDNNGGEGTTITDEGSGGNDGTMTNGPAFSTDVP